MSLYTELSHGFKRVYEEKVALQERPLYRALFPIYDEDTAAAFMLDKYVQTPYGIVYRASDNQSHIITYDPGSGILYEVPISSEKTGIGEKLNDLAIVGLEPTDSQARHLLKLIRDIVDFHMQCHAMTKIKQAIDVIRDGVFYARGVNGVSIGQDINYGRAVGNDITYDFTLPAAKMETALYEMWAPLEAQGCSPENLVVIMGKSWRGKFATDTTLQSKAETNAANVMLTQQMRPPELNGVKGLVNLAMTRPGSMLTPVFVCAYAPGIDYRAYKGAAAAPWIPDNEAIMFSLNSPRYYITRGMDVNAGADEIQRVSGELVFDSYTDKDPATRFARSITRHVFVPGNANHTVRSVGNF